jgi:dihydrofolate reductase
MRKIFQFTMITADGYFEGLNHDISWHNVDREFSDFAESQLDEADTLVFGRKTYDLMANFWPTAYAREADPRTAERMNGLDKVVFSHSLKEAAWEHTQLYSEHAPEVLNSLKEKPGKDILILASSNLCITLLKEKVIDEVRIMVNPLFLGKGTPLFAGLENPDRLTLTSNRAFKSGNVLLTYRIAK